MSETLICPRCGRRTVLHRDGIFRWRKCPAVKSCGWTVFNNGEDWRDKLPGKPLEPVTSESRPFA